jgi:hypothetical protein
MDLIYRSIFWNENTTLLELDLHPSSGENAYFVGPTEGDNPNLWTLISLFVKQIRYIYLKTGVEQAPEIQCIHSTVLNDESHPEKHNVECNAPSLEPLDLS